MPVEVFTNSEDGRQWWGEVVKDVGQDSEEILYATGFCASEDEAERQASQWLKDNPQR